MSKNVYVAARFGRRDEAVRLTRRLAEAGFNCTSSWVDAGTNISIVTDPAIEDAYRAKWSAIDVQDVANCDVMIMLADSIERGKGGKHVEFGIALALGKTIVVVGARENIFHWHPAVRVEEDLESAFNFLLTHRSLRTGKPFREGPATRHTCTSAPEVLLRKGGT